ncbi:MAG: lytic transglycosylase domain-containing protein [Clostridium sp.]
MKKKFKIFIVFFLIFITLSVLAYRIIGKSIFPDKYSEIVLKYSKDFDVDPYLVFSVIKAESNFDIQGKSNKNARGLMQVTPSTAQWIVEQMGMEAIDIDSLYEPEINIKLGTWYLRNLRDEFGDNVDLILSAYNAGRGNVNKWLDDINYSKNGKDLDEIPFGETKTYVKRVKSNYKIYKKFYKY